MKFSIRQLRHVIQECLITESPLISADDVKNDEDLFARYHFTDELSSIMKDWNIQLIPSGKAKNAKLGAGVFGTVFDVALQGKRYALKVTENKKDFNAYSAGAKLKSKVPAIPSSALPQIFKQGSKGIWYFTLMEYLEPLSHTMKSSLSKDYAQFAKIELGITNKMIGKFSKDFVTNIKEHLIDAMRSSREELLSAVMSDKHLPELKSDLLNGKIWPQAEVRHNNVPEGFFRSESYFLQFFRQAFMSVKNSPAEGLCSLRISEIYANKLKPYIDFRHFPSGGQGKGDFSSFSKPQFEDKRVKKLMLALRWLDQNDYINGWSDAHFDNIMIRTSTNELVVADIGMFRFGSGSSGKVDRSNKEEEYSSF